MLGVADACFLIDWARFRRRELLANLFELVFVHEEVLAQIRSPSAIDFVSRLLARGALRLYPWSAAEEELYVQIRDEVALDPRIPSLERPDLLCLVIAYRTGGALLTENLGVLRVVQFHPTYSRVSAWTALEVLEQMVYKGLAEVRSVEDFISLVSEYCEDTKHVFSSRRMGEVVERVRAWLAR
uniref:DNA-binding protein n=1 Tax=Thermofilum pendens TaxID=2269 RepID=A0A7C3SM55_THEPE